MCIVLPQCLKSIKLILIFCIDLDFLLKCQILEMGSLVLTHLPAWKWLVKGSNFLLNRYVMADSSAFGHKTTSVIQVNSFGNYYTPRTTKLLGGILVSLRPSICPASVPCPSRITCPLCSAYSSGWIHFIFTHLIKQLPKVCLVSSFLQNYKIEIFGNFLKYVTLTSCFDSGSDVNH